MPKEEAAMCSPTSALVWDRGAFAPLGGRSQSTGIQPVLCRFEKEVLKDRGPKPYASQISSSPVGMLQESPQHSFPVLVLLVPGEPRSELAWIHRKVREKPLVSASLGMWKVGLNDSGSSLS